MKWSRYHWLHKQWAHSPVIGRSLRLEKKSHRMWLLGQPDILLKLLDTEPRATWLFITSMGKDILSYALRFTTRKRKSSTFDNEVLGESKDINRIETQVRMLWALSMHLPVEQCTHKEAISSAIDDWIYALMKHRVLGIERGIAPMVGWMTPRQRYVLKDYIEPFVPGDDDSEEERQLNALTWQYFLGLEPDNWDDKFYISIANRVPLFIEATFYLTQPLRLTWMRRPEPLIAVWFLQVWGWDSLASGLKAKSSYPLLRLEASHWFSWWFCYCWFVAPEFKNRREYYQYARTHHKDTEGMDSWELGRIGTEVPLIIQSDLVEAYPDLTALFQRFLNTGSSIFPDAMTYWDKIDALYQMYQTSLCSNSFQDDIALSFVADTP